jgi:hypothetical protein
MADFEIPKTCKAGVVVNEGPDFRVEVQTVEVPEPGEKFSNVFIFGFLANANKLCLFENRPWRGAAPLELHWALHVGYSLHVK